MMFPQNLVLPGPSKYLTSRRSQPAATLGKTPFVVIATVGNHLRYLSRFWRYRNSNRYTLVTPGGPIRHTPQHQTVTNHITAPTPHTN